LEVRAILQLNWKDEFGGSGLVHPVTTVQKFPNLLNLRKTTSPGGFFVFRARDYAQSKTISRRSFYKLDNIPPPLTLI
ncbi:TPA: hypothetical protein MBF86_005890, partial [Klebsiella pneumoniae]